MSIALLDALRMNFAPHPLPGPSPRNDGEKGFVALP